MNSIILKVIRPMCMRGERVEAGTTLKLSPLAAAEVLQSGRAELVHVADQRLCEDAVRADVRAVLKAERGRIGEPPADWPWRPIS